MMRTLASLRGPHPLSISRLVGLVLFAAAMGWLEAVVVVYIRAIIGIPPGSTFPPAEQIFAEFASRPWLLPTEQSREVATIVMLGSLAWILRKTPRGRWGAFLVAFGVWDITYYIALWVLLRWPPSLATMDLLFLIPPHPWWYQPVWLPVAISCVMIAGGLSLLRRSG
jgi:hypothetical protein